MTKRKTAGRVVTTLCGIILSLSGVSLAIHSWSNLPHPNTKQYEIQKPSLGEQCLYAGGVTVGLFMLGGGVHLINKGVSSEKENNYQ